MQTHLRMLVPVMASAVVLACAIRSGMADDGAVTQVIAGVPIPVKSGNKVLAPVRPNEPLTMNALLGFVNAEPVFALDVLRPIDENLREIAKKAQDIDEFKAEARRLIEDQLSEYVVGILKMTDAKSALTDEDKQMVDLRVNMEKSKLLSKYGGSEAQANQALRAEGSSVDKELRYIRRGLTVQMYLNKTLYPKIVITRQMVLDEYEKNMPKWQQGAEIELYTLTLPVSRYLPKQPGQNGALGDPIVDPTAEQIKQAKADAMTEAHQVIDRLKKGTNFAQEVQDEKSRDAAASTGGRTGHVKKGSLANPKLEEYAFSIPGNTVGAEPLLVSDGQNYSVMVIKIGDKKEARTVPFSEAQKQIEQDLSDKQRHQLDNEYRKKLVETAAIEKVNTQTMMEVVMDVAVARYATK